MDSFYGDPTSNTSGQGEHSVVPPEIIKWNWGAFFLTFIWGIGNQVWLSFLVFVPFIQFIVPFVLGAKGNEWAWRNKEWNSVDHFLEVQRKWAKWGFILFIVGVLLAIIFGIVLIIFALIYGLSLLENFIYLFESFGFDTSLLKEIYQLFTNDEINTQPNMHPSTQPPANLTPPTNMHPSTDQYQYNTY